ncbi:hypothetical protein [Streptomonospora salina]|uniref:Uncharacterized protein n=2 Tax=Streptomonospora salina TaxID=104205 RepID=A0A841E3Z4_9ACTN|nr:hypothetical protein [Streptomonospora salina]MBB5997875.1 hypothetical protein [Streptomonospora salina]
MTPGSPTPEGVEDEPLFPADSGASTQNMNAVSGDGAASANRAGDEFGGRPMFRGDSPAGSDGHSTAEIDLSEIDDGYGGRDRSLLPTNTVLLVAGFVAVLALGGGAAFFVATSGAGSDADLAAGEVPDTPADLETGDLFPDTVDVAGQSYSLSTTDDTDECPTAAHGGFGEVLAENSCVQIVRATYVAEDASTAVTVGIAAMGSPEEAQAAEREQDLGSSKWFAGLQGEDGSGAERMDVAGGHGSGARWGPYQVFSLSASSDGRVNDDRADGMAEVSEDFLDVPLESLGGTV